ncbi:ricin-type beta-trefoil lectin domain protein [Vibrio kyushuensis]|uniref:hypothetical protein n=1 Tax=Vibrio kyushuensis TaxID=2910249 RepID=UPI003D104A79
MFKFFNIRSLAVCALLSPQVSAQYFSTEIREYEPVQIKAAQYIYGSETAPICLSYKEGINKGLTGQRCEEYQNAQRDVFTFHPTSNNSFQIRSQSNYCLTYKGYENQVELTGCSGNADQQWKFSLGKKRITRAENTNHCLDIFKRDSNINSRIGIFKCANSGNEHQQWDLDYLSNTSTTESSMEASCQGDSQCENAFKIASRHAPIFYFDQEKLGGGKKGNCLPMDPNEYYQLRENGFTEFSGDMICSRDKRMLEDGRIPLSFHFQEANGYYYINYWIFHGHQQACFASSGIHRADWERVMVRVEKNNPDKMLVTYDVHGVWYTRSWEGDKQFDYHNDNGFKRPIVYNGKSSNASYYREGGSGGCAVMADYRNVGAGEKYYRWDTKANLVNLHDKNSSLAADWMLYQHSWDHWGDENHSLRGPLWRNELSRRGDKACKHHNAALGNDIVCTHSIEAGQTAPWNPNPNFNL